MPTDSKTSRLDTKFDENPNCCIQTATDCRTSRAAMRGTSRYRKSPCAEASVSADLIKSVDGIVTLNASLLRTCGAELGILPLRNRSMIPEQPIANLNVARHVSRNTSFDNNPAKLDAAESTTCCLGNTLPLLGRCSCCRGRCSTIRRSRSPPGTQTL